MKKFGRKRKKDIKNEKFDVNIIRLIIHKNGLLYFKHTIYVVKYKRPFLYFTTYYLCSKVQEWPFVMYVYLNKVHLKIEYYCNF